MVPVLVPALTGLLLFCTSAASLRAAFIIGWWFGFGHFVAGFYWVGNSFVVADVGVFAASAVTAKIPANTPTSATTNELPTQ
jgi:apolipoprotein N-acyltransferase